MAQAEVKKGRKVSQLKAQTQERKVTGAKSKEAFQVLAWGLEAEKVCFPFWEWLPQEGPGVDHGHQEGVGRERPH